MLNHFLTISVLAGLAFVITGGEDLLACKVVETAIFNSSKVHYPGERQSVSLW